MNHILLPQLLKWVLGAALMLLLFGILPAGELILLLGLFIAARFYSLFTEARRPPMSLQRWQELTEELARAYDRCTPEQRAAQAGLFKLEQEASARQLAEERVRRLVRGYKPPRSRLELIAEALGVVAFTALLPADVALQTHDFFSLRLSLGYLGAAVTSVSVALYAVPHLWRQPGGRAGPRILWWALPFPPALLYFLGAMALDHTYLNPFHPDHNRLAAARVLALKDIIVAGRHADWLSRYARQLERQGDLAGAARFYRESLRRDPSNREVRGRLAALPGYETSDLAPATERRVVSPVEPYWAVGQTLVRPAPCRIDAQLSRLEECSVVLVPVGAVPDQVLAAVGHAIRHELQLPVLLSTLVVPLPEHTRVRGLITGRQWDQRAVVQAFLRACPPLPKAPVKYLLLTPADIYSQGANYVFSTSYQGWAVVSFARYGEATADQNLLSHRTAKQSLCALLKTFGLPPSLDRDCVTSYTHDLNEFDAKGNRPNAATWAQFRRQVVDDNRQWQTFKASHAPGP